MKDNGTVLICTRSPSKLTLTTDEVKTIQSKKLKLLRFDESAFRKDNNVPNSIRSNVFYTQLMNEIA